MKINLLNRFLAIVIISICYSCKGDHKNSASGNEPPDDAITASPEIQYRPNYHFSSKQGWINDPNGMFFYNGYYHLYYQHHPDSTIWGPMHWGHAISTDMISWKEMPIALYPDELGDIWSGSAIIDIENTSGLGTASSPRPVIAMFTHAKKSENENEPWRQTQGIAYSLDEGKTFTKFPENPVIDNRGIPEFRDPKVNWNEEHKQWTMVLAAGQEIMFYSSKDLKTWRHLSNFGVTYGNHDGVWECPDFFPLKVTGSEATKWVLLVSINPGGPNGGSATQYFIGDFDGTNFTLDPTFKSELAREHNFWVDYGRDNYAGVGWSNVRTASGGKLFMGWMSNWMYANDVPTDPWRGAMTSPRELHLIKGAKTYRLVSNPVRELNNYRGTKYKVEDIFVKDEIPLITSDKIDLSKAEIYLKIEELTSTTYNFKLSNKAGDELLFGYNNKDRIFYVDRSKSGKVNFSEKFADRISRAPRTSKNEGLTATVLLDKTSIELFFDNGETVMTEIFFPLEPFDSLSVASENEAFTINYMETHELKFN
ncbi:MAG TPA: glycoside hydrolase family 32 protein [Eudoraea sp.]|nr:glycoside hydrolase family 32 protein [Eudoraea sp.]